MAQVLKLKRTAVQGKVPNTSNLELGELAINTYDGRLFFEKDDGSPSIQEILTTGGPITGSLLLSGSVNIQGDITATSFSGDGSGLTNLNVTASVSEEASVTASFETSSVVSVTHGFDSRNIHVSVYDDFNSQIIPQTVTLITTDSVEVTFSSPESGYVVVAKGGHILSGSAIDSNTLNGESGSYYLDYNNFTNVPTTTYRENVSGSSTYSISHSLEEEYPIVQSWNTSTNKQELASDIESTSNNSLTITFENTFDGIIVVKK